MLQPTQPDEFEDNESAISERLGPFGGPEMTADEKIRGWFVEDSNIFTDSTPLKGEEAKAEARNHGLGDSFDNEPLHQGEQEETNSEYQASNEQEADIEVILMSELDNARINFVVNTDSFSWLLKVLQCRSQLDYSSATVHKSIRQTVSSKLSQHRGSRALWPQRVGIRIPWDPRVFIQQQEYDNSKMLSTALTITGNATRAQLSSCRDYLDQVWPVTGNAVLQGIIRATDEESLPLTITLFDGMQLSLELEDGSLQAQCVGLFDSIVEVIEIIAWISCALRESTSPDKITYCTANLGVDQKCTERDSSAEFLIDFTEEDLPAANSAELLGCGCWLDGLMKNPVIARGFPTAGRPDGTSGLELPLEAMALLVGATQLTVFNNRMLVKGFNAAVVPTAYSDSVIQWHFLLNNDGTRLPYGDPRIMEGPELLHAQAVAQVQKARHILGWTSAAAYNIGMDFLASRNPRRE